MTFFNNSLIEVGYFNRLITIMAIYHGSNAKP